VGESYFVVHAPRQIGKTTTFMAFASEPTAPRAFVVRGAHRGRTSESLGYRVLLDLVRRGFDGGAHTRDAMLQLAHALAGGLEFLGTRSCREQRKSVRDEGGTVEAQPLDEECSDGCQPDEAPIVATTNVEGQIVTSRM
jgi:hypothetical protein